VLTRGRRGALCCGIQKLILCVLFLVELGFWLSWNDCGERLVECQSLFLCSQCGRVGCGLQIKGFVVSSALPVPLAKPGLQVEVELLFRMDYQAEKSDPP
jgi:hypothetical protein